MAIDTEKRRNPSEIAAREAPGDDVGRTYRFHGIEVDAAAGRLLVDGQERFLRLKTWEVLVALLRNRHRIVTKDELRETVWRDVVVDDDAIVQCVVDIRRALGDDSRNPRFIRTIPKVGYRFVGEVEERAPAPPMASGATLVVEEVTSVEVEVEVDDEDALERRDRGVIDVKTLPSPGLRRRALWLLLPLGLAGVVAAILWLRRPQVATELGASPGKKAVTVLLFENPSADAELEWLRQGLADMLVADLSGSGKLNVLSRQQLHVLMAGLEPKAGEALPLTSALELARRSRADALVLGSFTRLGDHIRIQAQIHDAADGALLRAESVTAERQDRLFGEVDRLASRLLLALGVTEPGVLPSPGIVVARTGSLPAYRLYVQALEKAEAFHTSEALELLEKAVELDPGFAMAHARIGFVYVFTWGRPEEGKPHLETAYRLSDRLTDVERLAIHAWYGVASGDFDRAIGAMRRLLSLDPRDTETAVRLAGVLRGEQRNDEAIAVLEAACEAAPGAALPRNSLAGVYSAAGRHAEAIASARRYVELAPKERNAYDTLGYVLHWAGRYEEAIAEFRRSLELDPGFDVAQVHLGNSLFQLGRQREAIAAFQEYLRLAPSDMERMRAHDSLAIVHYRRGELDRAWAEALQRVAYEPARTVGVEVLIAWERGDRASAERFLREASPGTELFSRGNRGSRRGDLANRGALAVRRGHVEEGLNQLRAALREGALLYNVDPYEGCLAEAFVDLKRWEEAIAECERILRLNANEPFAHYRLGVSLQAKGDAKRAREELTRFLAIWKGADADARELVDAQSRLRALGR